MLKTIIVSFAVIGLVIYMFNNSKGMKVYKHCMNRKKMLEESLMDFKLTEMYSNHNVAIGINNENEFCISVFKKNGTLKPMVYKFKDIKGCQVLEDGVPVLDTSSNGYSCTNISLNKVKRIDLKVLFNDIDNAFILANFLFWEIYKDSKEYHNIKDDAFHWYELINNIIVESPVNTVVV